MNSPGQVAFWACVAIAGAVLWAFGFAKVLS